MRDEFEAREQLKKQEHALFDEVLAYGKAQAKKHGLKPSDVAEAIAEVRKANNAKPPNSLEKEPE